MEVEMSVTELRAASRGISPATKALLSSLLGSTIEWYEFFIYGTAAALVFNKLFFPQFDSLAGTLLSLSTFAIAFVARPVGAAIFGHFGDRVGRKATLVITLTMMGACTFLIGVLPSYESAGVWATVALVFLRILQGLSLGGEYSGAVLISIEHAGPKRAGFFGALIASGAAWGLILASLSFFAVSKVGEVEFLAWGWRLPFLLSAILVIVGIIIRLKVSESPEFEAMKATHQVRGAPLVEVLRDHTMTVVLTALSTVASGNTFYVAAVFSLTYGTQHLGVDRSTMLLLVMVGFAIAGCWMAYLGRLSDRYGHKKMFLIGAAFMTISPFPFFQLLEYRNFGVMLIAFLVLFLPFCANYALLPTFVAEAFPAPIRYSGMAFSYTVGSVLSSAVWPLIATYLLGVYGSWYAIAIYLSVTAVISFGSAVLIRPSKIAPI
jgi:MFS family permease